MNKITKNDILPAYQKMVTIQDYGGKVRIEGVELVPLKYYVDDGGDFCEVVRFNGEGLESVPGFKPKQMSYSYVQPGGVKGFHVHYKQTDVWFVPPRRQLLVGLHDLRKDSPTAGVTMRFVLGGAAVELLVIPPGVAHGMANIWKSGSRVIYLTNQQFDAKNPDEQRLPWDFLGADFWEARKE